MTYYFCVLRIRSTFSCDKLHQKMNRSQGQAIFGLCKLYSGECIILYIIHDSADCSEMLAKAISNYTEVKI